MGDSPWTGTRLIPERSWLGGNGAEYRLTLSANGIWSAVYQVQRQGVPLRHIRICHPDESREWDMVDRQRVHCA